METLNLEEKLFIEKVLSYEIDLIEMIEDYINRFFTGYCELLIKKSPFDETEYSEGFVKELKQLMIQQLKLSEAKIILFQNIRYAIKKNLETFEVFFNSQNLLEVFKSYLLEVTKDDRLFEGDEGEDDTFFSFLYCLFYEEEEIDAALKKRTVGIVIDFCCDFYLCLHCNDFQNLYKALNIDFIVSPNDNHIPIRIAILEKLNLISELNNSMPNREDIYRTIHAIVGGNEDNVKKYCLSIIGNNSTSQKQITKKHRDFAQKFINGKKF
ncbi:hypothetical protein CMT52_08935 [Elizabethkingia anophelis]|nr:hypothetical protein [Elizabethkingia anophelis]MDV4024458.1 hypothetical protein [Elizabethkingia anophelis]